MRKESEVPRKKVIYWCDIALAALCYWQAVGAQMPMTVLATGIVLAVRKAASPPEKGHRC
jgi:hypothetical protein